MRIPKRDQEEKEIEATRRMTMTSLRMTTRNPFLEYAERTSTSNGKRWKIFEGRGRQKKKKWAREKERKGINACAFTVAYVFPDVFVFWKGRTQRNTTTRRKEKVFVSPETNSNR